MCWHCMIWVRQQHIYSFDSAAVERLFIRYDHLCMTELHVVFFLLGDSPVSEFYVPTFRNTLSVPFWILCAGVSELSFCSIWILCADVSEHTICSILNFMCRRFGTLLLFHLNFMCRRFGTHYLFHSEFYVPAFRNSPSVPFEFYVPTFWNTLSVPSELYVPTFRNTLFRLNFMCRRFLTLCSVWILCAGVSEHSFCSILILCADVSEHSVPFEFYVPMFRNTVCPIFIGSVSRKNNRVEIVGGIYIYGKGFGSKIAWANQKEGAGLNTETGCGQQGPQVVARGSVRGKQRCVEARKRRHWMVEIKILCFRWRCEHLHSHLFYLLPLDYLPY